LKYVNKGFTQYWDCTNKRHLCQAAFSTSYLTTYRRDRCTAEHHNLTTDCAPKFKL